MYFLVPLQVAGRKRFVHDESCCSCLLVPSTSHVWSFSSPMRKAGTKHAFKAFHASHTASVLRTYLSMSDRAAPIAAQPPLVLMVVMNQVWVGWGEKTRSKRENTRTTKLCLQSIRRAASFWTFWLLSSRLRQEATPEAHKTKTDVK